MEKYEEALERARGIYNGNPSSSTAKVVCEQIFPELKESEDERIRKEIVDEIKEQINNIPAPDCCDSDDLKRLATLKSWIAYLEKKPTECGEEDELMRTVTIQTLETLGGRGTTGMQIDWLKSLRPSWKPSEEQMSALNYFIKLWGNSDDQLEYTQIFNTVKSLRDDLKKLM